MREIRAEGSTPGNTGNNDIDIMFTIETFDDRVRRCDQKHLYYPGKQPRYDPDYGPFTSGPAAKKVTNHQECQTYVREAKRAGKGK